MAEYSPTCEKVKEVNSLKATIYGDSVEENYQEILIKIPKFL